MSPVSKEAFMSSSPLAASAVVSAPMTVRPNATPVADLHEYLAFRIGDEEYGIDILNVQEIRSYEEPTRLANSPALIKGVLDLRGVIVPIADLRLRFGTEPRLDAVTVTIVMNVGGRVMGAVVDSVSDVVGIAINDIKAAPAFTGAVEGSHMTGIATIESAGSQRMVILLDIGKLMCGVEMGLVPEALQ
jgi:purine-binding chemotaxis protein CheW